MRFRSVSICALLYIPMHEGVSLHHSIHVIQLCADIPPIRMFRWVSLYRIAARGKLMTVNWYPLGLSIQYQRIQYEGVSLSLWLELLSGIPTNGILIELSDWNESICFRRHRLDKTDFGCNILGECIADMSTGKTSSGTRTVVHGDRMGAYK